MTTWKLFRVDLRKGQEKVHDTTIYVVARQFNNAVSVAQDYADAQKLDMVGVYFDDDVVLVDTENAR